MNDLERFHDKLSETLVPHLKADGFKMSGNVFRRFEDDVIHVIEIQGARSGGQCALNLGIHLRFLPTVGTNQNPTPKITEPECEFRRRYVPDGESDHWFAYGTTDEEALESAFNLARAYIDWSRPYFDRFRRFPEHFIQVTSETYDGRDPSVFPPTSTETRALLALARIYTHLNRADESVKFATRGLQSIGSATALKAAFKVLLRQAKDA